MNLLRRGIMNKTPIRGAITVGNLSSFYGYSSPSFGDLSGILWKPDTLKIVNMYTNHIGNTLLSADTQSIKYDDADVVSISLFSNQYSDGVLLATDNISWGGNAYTEIITTSLYDVLSVNVGNTLGIEIVKVS